MVDELRRAGVVRDGPVEAALRAVERHRFLPAVPVARAYADEAVVTQTAPDGLPTSSASQPSIVAIMLRQLAVQPGHRVLEIGAGTGYNAALLAHLAGHSGQVTTIDVDPVTASAAGRHLAAAGVEGVEVVTADGWLGHPAGAPYDRIEATVGSWDVSTSWVDQLAEGGVLVVPLWLGPGVQASAAFTRNGRELHSAGVVPCGFIRLRGAGAGPETYRRVAGRLVSAERLGAEESSVLERLLATEPSSAPSPPAAPGWLVRLALAGHRAVLLVDEPGRRVAAGLFDPAAGSLVLAEGIGGRLGTWSPETVRCYGGDALLPPLLALLADPEPLEVEQLRVLGVRRGDLLPAAPGSGRTWLLERPEHRFLVRG
jgi:protein-L-isoaspartate(D-aspartate) O-methyltransferase